MDATHIIENLTLMLMFITFWLERDADPRRCWESYDFDVLDKLEGAGFISSRPRANSDRSGRGASPSAGRLFGSSKSTGSADDGLMGSALGGASV